MEAENKKQVFEAFFSTCNHYFYIKKIVASLHLKNEREERLSSHRSDHVTGVWGRLHNLCNVQRIFNDMMTSFLITEFPN